MFSRVMRSKSWLFGVGIVTCMVLLDAQTRESGRNGVIVSPVLTSDLLKKMFLTQQELAKLEARRPPKEAISAEAEMTCLGSSDQ